MESWAGWNPAAGFFHDLTRQGVYADPAAFEAALRRKARLEPMPAVVKPRARRVTALPPPATGTPLARIATARRTWRRFGRKPITAAELAQLLWLTNGITHWLRVPGTGEVPLSLCPSGGARQPVETYVAVMSVSGLRPGVYRYAPDRHELDHVRGRLSAAEVRRFTPTQPWVGDCAAVVFFTGVFERTRWRYGFPRAYRAVLIECGHRCQNFLLGATSLGLAPFCTMALDDARIERCLRLDGIAEAVLYSAAVGNRPQSAGRVVMPKGTPPPTVRVNRLSRAEP